MSPSLPDVSQLSYLEEAPRDLALSDSICCNGEVNGQVLVWSVLVNGTLLAFDPDTCTCMCKVLHTSHTHTHTHTHTPHLHTISTLPSPLPQMQVPISDDSAYFTVTCFTVWRHTLWVGTNKGTIAVMDAEDGKCIHEIFFPGGRRKQVEIKHLALSSEDEVNSMSFGLCSLFSIGVCT